MNTPAEVASPVTVFVERWRTSGAAERANYALFLSELCDVLGVPRPEPTRADDAENAYVFERAVTFHYPDGSTSPGRIDLYRRGAFVLEAKQGATGSVAKVPASADAGDDGLLLPVAPVAGTAAKRHKKGTATRGTAAWDTAMLAARGQAEGYARALPASEGRPPFLVVVDVGHSLELYSEFTRSGATYVPFPDPRSHRLKLEDLARPEVRETLRQVWLDPLSLDPTRRSARVTREIAGRLGELARSLEGDGHTPEIVASFLMRAIFTMFAEDVELLPKESFLVLLESRRGRLGSFVPQVEELWGRMNTGGFSVALDAQIRHFNGGLFADARALPLSADQLERLIEAARADWREVEPSIFGTLLERALDPRERHKLGAHYTPRAYVERLVLPTVIEPLRAEWAAVQAAVVTWVRQNRPREAVGEVERFHRRLCTTRVLDPACGSCNFLYVTLEHLKRLEGEVLNSLADLDQNQANLEMEEFAVGPHQLLGIEANPRAAAIAELVLWIGHLQWHFRTRGNVAPREPIIQNFCNIELRDGVLTWERTEPVLDGDGLPVTRWDGRTTRTHPVTGREVPDDTTRVPLVRYVNPSRAEWPDAEFIVGNPPFIGVRRMRAALGDGYVEALWRAWNQTVPRTVDFVMYWWRHAAELVAAGRVRRFGFITTNSITQTFNRPVVEAALDANVGLRLALPDHPWVDSSDGAAVRVALTVGQLGVQDGTLQEVVAERSVEGDGAAEVTFRTRQCRIHADLSCGANVAGATPLQANAGLCFQGMNLVGEGFRVDAAAVARLGFDVNGTLPPVVRRYQKGRPLLQGGHSGWVLDAFGLSAEELRDRYPSVYQHLFDHVKPERDQNNRAGYRKHWWMFGEARGRLRRALAELSRYVATVETSKFKPFVFLDAAVVPDHKLYALASDDAFHLGVLSSRVHGAWVSAAGGHLGVGNDPTWTNTTTFLPFPFPEATDAQTARIRDLGERLDAHRKARQAFHPELTLTEMYNVLERLHAATALSDKERATYDAGLVEVLRQFHDELDAAVANAYGWPMGLPDDELLTRLVALNAARVAEEKTGRVRWLRPKFQHPATASGTETVTQGEIGLETGATDATTGTLRHPWPSTLPEQARAVRSALQNMTEPTSAAAVARLFTGVRPAPVGELLETLALLGQARQLPDGRFVGQL